MEKTGKPECPSCFPPPPMSLLHNKLVILGISACTVQLVARSSGSVKDSHSCFSSCDNGIRAGTHPGKPLQDTSDKIRKGAFFNHCDT